MTDCPTQCDPDCTADCHEYHQPYWKREEHDHPGAAPLRPPPTFPRTCKDCR